MDTITVKYPTAEHAEVAKKRKGLILKMIFAVSASSAVNKNSTENIVMVKS